MRIIACRVMGLAFVISFTGCAATNTYFAGRLPPELEAPVVENPQTIDLSRLAMAATGSEVIEGGDVLEVSISTGLETSDIVTFPVRVNENGASNLPGIGRIALAGLQLDEAEGVITSACITRDLYLSPRVTVLMKRKRKNRVTVIGAVKEPGIYEVPSGSSDLLAAIVSAGGLAEDADVDVEIRRPGFSGTNRTSPDRITDGRSPDINHVGHMTHLTGNSAIQSVRVNLAAAAEAGTSGYHVEDGGIVMVERRDPQQIQVIGRVRKPGRYEYPFGQELRVLDAIALAQGLSSNVADKVFVIRKLPDRPEPAVIQLSLRRAKRNAQVNLRLMPGDTVSVEQTFATVVLDAIRVVNFAVGASLFTL